MGTSLQTAPAVIGSVNLGVEPTVTHLPDGIRVTGCDFVTNATPLNTVYTTWATVAGFAVAPYSLGSNTLSDMSRQYGEFLFERLAVAYVPSVGTSANGQVAIYRKTTRSSPGLDPSGSNFFQYVLNQRTGVVGPVWQPLTIEFPPSKRWMSTLPLDGTDIDEEADGEVFMATNNNANGTGIAPSIGMMKIFYMVRFRKMERNSRSILIPLANQIYLPIALGVSAVTAIVGDPWSPNVIAFDQTGANASLPGGTVIGDIFKFIVDASRSSFGTTSATNTLSILLVGQRFNINITGYVTLYGLYTPNGWQMYQSFANAVTQTDGLQYGVAQTANTVVLRGLVSLVGNITSRVNQTL